QVFELTSKFVVGSVKEKINDYYKKTNIKIYELFNPIGHAVRMHLSDSSKVRSNKMLIYEVSAIINLIAAIPEYRLKINDLSYILNAYSQETGYISIVANYSLISLANLIIGCTGVSQKPVEKWVDSLFGEKDIYILLTFDFN